MILHEDAEFISHEFGRRVESPLDELDLTEEFPKATYPTCLLCNFNVTLEAHYFKGYEGPYCDVCYKYILGKEETDGE